MSFVLGFVAMLAIVAAMSIGVMFGREPIRGSCGGLGRLGIDAECKLCGGNPSRCADVRSNDAHIVDAKRPGDRSANASSAAAVTQFDPSANRSAAGVDRPSH